MILASRKDVKNDPSFARDRRMLAQSLAAIRADDSRLAKAYLGEIKQARKEQGPLAIVVLEQLLNEAMVKIDHPSIAGQRRAMSRVLTEVA